MLGLLTTPGAAVELQPRTVAAFDRYVRVTEAQMAVLRVDDFADVERGTKLAELRRG